MGDFKSKLPNFQEITNFAGKLFKDVKASVGEIVDEYKKHRENAADAAAKKPVESEIIASKQEETPTKTTVSETQIKDGEKPSIDKH